MKKEILFLIFVAVIITLSIFLFKNETNPGGIQEEKIVSDSDFRAIVRLGGADIQVKIVDTDESRMKGLSGVTGIALDHGMLFVFDTPGIHMFWMKDMHFPIDIIWFNELKQIVHIEKNVQPESYPQNFGPKEKTSSFVLEVFSGFSDKYALKIGDTISFVNFDYSNVPR